MVGKRCRQLGPLVPGEWTRAQVRVAAKRRAAGKRVRIGFTVRAPRADVARARAILKVRR